MTLENSYSDGLDKSHYENKYIKIIVDTKEDQLKFDSFLKQIYDCNPAEVKSLKIFQLSMRV